MEESPMKALFTIAVAGALLAGGSAHGQAGAQANASASGSASTQGGTPGAQALGKGAASSSASARAGQNSASLSSGTAVNAALSQPIDAKKNKPGDAVTARTTEATKSEGKVVIPKGSKLVGHVTEAKARTKAESESAVGIVFDKAILKDGREVPLNVTLQAVGAAQSEASSSLAGDDLSAGGGMAGRTSGHVGAAGTLGGVTSTAGAGAGAVTNTAANVGGVTGGTGSNAVNSTANVAGATRATTSGATGGLSAAGRLTSNSRGVFGLEGMSLSSGAANNTQDSLITSTSRNVHLDGGTQLLLVSQGGVAGNK
jgi:hypothetical protein